MEQWERDCIITQLKSLQGTMQYTYGSDHEALLKSLEELNVIIKMMFNFDITE